MAKAKVCVICHKYQMTREYLPLHTALERQFDVTRHFVDDKWPESVTEIKHYRSYDAVLWFVRFREFVTKSPFAWHDFNGMRLMYDQDAYMNSSMLINGRFLGAWPKVFHANKLDVLLCTGKATRDNLREAGINAIWVPKAYDHTRFYDKGESRNGVCYFGELYDARAAMLKYLKRGKVSVNNFKCSFFELNDHLNRFAICVICNMVTRRIQGRFGPLSYLLPGRQVEFLPGPEVMLKNFEVAASGCVQFCDAIPEMSDLGFVDEQTMVSYKDFSELKDKLAWYLASPELLGAISSNAAKLCAEKHTWDHRARMVADVLSGQLAE